ncbi:non-specific lipid transfer protein GPI-anchored 25 [Phoenix dactylifera]|uniref:Non-specific lipid transfer protein GPI-anchored 25 n=1 Tax=Phoenix dactylifera TaxID=42345 RepID=A0A8B9A3C6_PHODC|nr:non-specific lipid transfer protein GPI-anchored 25 [Phoenix dactylifera]
MNPFPAVALALHVAAAIASAAPAPSPPPIGCAVELVAMSTCLPHVAAPPNNPTPAPSAACCATFFSALDGAGGGATCLCHLVREPSLLGFPLNASRIVSLFSTCAASDAGAASSFAEICQDSPTLPPLRDATPPDPVNQQPGKSTYVPSSSQFNLVYIPSFIRSSPLSS